MVLEAISKDVTEELKRISLYFEGEVFSSVFREVYECMLMFRKEEMMKAASKMDNTEDEQTPHKVDPSNVILSSSQITNYLLFKSNVLSTMESNLHFKAIKYIP